MTEKYRIVERTWSLNNKDYQVQKYSKKWYSKKYKWRTMEQYCTYSDGSRRLAIFPSKEEAEEFINEQLKYYNKVISEKVIKEY